MARRNITWDYPDAVKNPKGVEYRNARTLLEPIPYEPGVYRCPKDMAPQQFGYVICPLEPKSKSVTVDLGGYINPDRGSEWRACLVAVNSKQESRYGDIFAKGKSSMTLKADENELYLVVAATPKTMNIDMAGDSPRADYRCFEQSQFPFTVKMTGCEPKDIFIPAKPTVPGKAHPNGGGFVADTAKVDATAYVGPNAQVLGQCPGAGKCADRGLCCCQGQRGCPRSCRGQWTWPGSDQCASQGLREGARFRQRDVQAGGLRARSPSTASMAAMMMNMRRSRAARRRSATTTGPASLTACTPRSTKSQRASG